METVTPPQECKTDRKLFRLSLLVKINMHVAFMLYYFSIAKSQYNGKKNFAARNKQERALIVPTYQRCLI